MRSHLEWLRYRRNCTQAVRCSPRRRSIHRTGLGTTRGDRSCMQIHSCNRCTTSIHRSRHLPWQKHHNCKQMDWCTLPERNALATEIFTVVKSIAHARQAQQSSLLGCGQAIHWWIRRTILRLYPQIRAFTAKKQVRTHK